MSDTSSDTSRKLTEFTDSSNIEKIIEYGPWSQIKVAKGVSVDKVFNDLKAFEGVTFYKTENLPDHFRFKNHQLIYDIIMVANRNDKVQLANDVNHADLYEPKATSPFNGKKFNQCQVLYVFEYQYF